METATSGDRANAARWLSLLLGSWLFVSAFVWPHPRGTWTNTWVVGMLIATFASLALALPGARKVNSLLAAWLFVSTLAYARTDLLTLIHNGLLAIAILGLSLIPPFWLGRRTVREEYVGVW